MKLFYKLCSYIYPITVFKGKSDYNPCLEVTWYNGKQMLNTANANYSFGNLHQIFQEAFRESHLAIKSNGKVLLLGLGGGSVVDILRKEYGFQGKTVAIEIDPLVIGLYDRYFKDSSCGEIELICEDAEVVMKELAFKSFDLIVCDLFIDLEVPSFVFEESFVQSLKALLTTEGVVYMNIMVPHNQSSITANDLIQVFFRHFYEVKRMNYHDRNLFMVAKKPK